MPHFFVAVHDEMSHIQDFSDILSGDNPSNLIPVYTGETHVLPTFLACIRLPIFFFISLLLPCKLAITKEVD